MTSVVAPQPRGAAPNAARLREILNEWEKGTLAPLTQRQSDSVVDIAVNVNDRPIPDLPKDIEAEEEDVAPATPTPTRQGTSTGSTPTTPAPSQAQPLLEPGQVIDNSQQFFAWFEGIEAQIELQEEEAFHSYLGLLEQYSARCGEVLSEVDNALAFLKALEEQYTSVSTKTNALHDACEELLQDQTSLVNLTESISSRLSYFTELQRLTSKFNSPTLSVLSEQFVPLLTRLDECIAFVDGHPHYKDSPVYLARFRQLQGRGLNLVKLHVMHTLRTATSNVATQIQGANTDDSFTLFYGKFRTHAPRIKALMKEIERRGLTSSEYSALLDECYACYFAQRLALLLPSMGRAIDTVFAENRGDLVASVRGGCTHIVRVCRNEHQLYKHFFSSMSPGLDVMLEELANLFYDRCRPIFISTTVPFDTLVDLCSILKAEMGGDSGDELTAFAAVAEQMLQDAQQRLVYRAQAIIHNNIRSFTPSPQDLAYPDALEAAAWKQQQQKSSAKDTAAQSARSDAAAARAAAGDPGYDTWYPSLTHALLLISKLYRSVDKAVCQGLAQEALTALMGSLKSAKATIASSGSVDDAQLFMTKYLLILREQIAPFDFEFSSVEYHLDFSQFRSAVGGLLANSGELLRMDRQNALLSFLLNGAPSVTETSVDARKEVDDQLRELCQDYIQRMSKALTAPITSFLTKVDALPEESRKSLSQQSFATPEKVRLVVKDADAVLRRLLPRVSSDLSLYLDNKDTEHILFRPIKTAVLEEYQRLMTALAAYYPSVEDRQVIGCPTTEHVTLATALDSRALGQRLRAKFQPKQSPPSAAKAAPAASAPPAAPAPAPTQPTAPADVTQDAGPATPPPAVAPTSAGAEAPPPTIMATPPRPASVQAPVAISPARPAAAPEAPHTPAADAAAPATPVEQPAPAPSTLQEEM